MEKRRSKDERKTLRFYPGGVRALGESFRVEVDSDTVVEDSWWEACLDEVVGTCAHGRRGNYLGRMDWRDVSGELGCVQVERRWWAHDEYRCASSECVYHFKRTTQIR